MRFKATGTFTTEAVVEIAQRLMAELQEAEVRHIQDVSVYLSVIDKTGARRELSRGDAIVDAIVLDCTDLATPTPVLKLEMASAGRAPRRTPGPSRRKRS